VDKNDFSIRLDNRHIRFDCAFIIIHGTPGENGLLQSYFELLKIPYTSCNAFVSALTFDKYACKAYLRDSGIDMADDILLKKDENVDAGNLVKRLGLPVFVKPNAGGSSFGVTKVNSADELNSALDSARNEGCDEVIVESFIKGRELSHGICIMKDSLIVLPVTEIVSKNEFFDFEAKYTAGKSEEITPARIPDELVVRVQSLTEQICRRLGCRGFSRVDYIYSNDKLYFLEINTIPGFSDASIVPQQLRHAGYEISEVLDALVQDSI
jgi:D-alanine-D-alanine ligase